MAAFEVFTEGNVALFSIFPERFSWVPDKLIVRALLVAVLGCSSAGGQPPSVVLIVIDTLRADHVGSFGYHRNTTPHLDEIASRSVLFENASSAIRTHEPDLLLPALARR